MSRRPRLRSPIATLAALGLLLAGCYELGNPITRTTRPGLYPTSPPYLTSTRVEFARARDAVAWTRPPAHAVDPRLPAAPFVGRITVEHGDLFGARRGRVELVTELLLLGGERRRLEWQAPAENAIWTADVALPAPVELAITRPRP